MTMRYDSFSPRGVDRGEGNPTVPLSGITQIPEEADDWWKQRDDELPPRLIALCDAAILQAMLEHRRRREAAKLGINLSSYWPGDRDRDDEDDA